MCSELVNQGQVTVLATGTLILSTAGSAIIHIVQVKDLRLGDINFSKVTWLISKRTRIRTQGGMTPNLEPLTTSLSA